MRTIRITAKRQATLPKDLCEDMGVGPGDDLQVQRRVIDGQEVWVLAAGRPDWSWVGCARPFAAGKEHDWAAVEASIAKGMAG